jgi:hypothetical protein
MREAIRAAPTHNGLEILLARAIWWQAQDHKHNLAAYLPVLKRAPSSAVYRADPH